MNKATNQIADRLSDEEIVYLHIVNQLPSPYAH